MLEENWARLRAHRNNIDRYRRLLATQLSEVEQAFILKRLEQEQSIMDALAETTTLPTRVASATA